MAINCPNTTSGLGSVVVLTSTMFALWSGVSDGLAAIVIVQAGIFADASRQLVRQVHRVWGFAHYSSSSLA